MLGIIAVSYVQCVIGQRKLLDLAVILITLANLFLPTPLPPCVPKFLPAILLLKEKTERVIYIDIQLPS